MLCSFAVRKLSSFLLTLLAFPLAGSALRAQNRPPEPTAARAAPAASPAPGPMGAAEPDPGPDSTDAGPESRPASDSRDLTALLATVDRQRRSGDYVAGLAGARDGLARAVRRGDERLQAAFLNRQGRLFWNLGDYPDAIESNLQELRLADKLGDARLQARAHLSLGTTYYRFGRQADALVHFSLARTLAESVGDREDLAMILNGLGDYYLTAQDYDRAGEMHQRALALRQALGQKASLADSLTNLGLVAAAKGDPERALANLQQALEIYQKYKFKRYLANTHRRMATVLRQVGRTDEAVAHLQEAMRIALPLQSADVMADIYAESAATAERRGDFAAALDDERKREAETEKVRNERVRQTIAELEAKSQADAKELQIKLLQRADELKVAEIRRRRFESLALAAGLVVGLTAAGAIILLQRARLRSERLLRSATEEARGRAEEAERLKTQLLQMASHDLKVPLRALQAHAELLLAESPLAPAPDVRRLAANMRSDASRMRSLVEDFLTAATMERGTLQLRMQTLDLAAVAREAAEGLLLVAAGKQQPLTLDPASTPALTVLADGPRLRQVFDNLLSNALKFSPFGGAVRVAFGRVGGWGFAEVHDSGPGLTPEDFGRLFDRERPLSAAPTGGEDSSGMGLIIARELIALQGGRLEVESRPGVGAVFRILLRLESAEAGASEGAAVVAAAAAG